MNKYECEKCHAKAEDIKGVFVTVSSYDLKRNKLPIEPELVDKNILISSGTFVCINCYKEIERKLLEIFNGI